MAAIRRSITVALAALGLLFFGALTLLSCSGRNAEWYGTWEGTVDRASPDMPDDSVKRTINTVRLTVLPDGTFELMDSGITKTGTHTLSGDEATFKIKMVLDRPIEDLGDGAVEMNLELKAVMEDDGSMSFTDPAGFDDEPVRMTLSTQRS